jgi:GNAT superfamily N-acetyltransferase
MRIIDLSSDNLDTIQQVATLLVKGFQEHWPSAWSDMDAALEEVEASFGVDRISRVALDDNGIVLGWIGGIRQYNGNVWELHPLVVHPDHQGKGIGRALATDLEDQRERGATSPSGLALMTRIVCQLFMEWISTQVFLGIWPELETCGGIRANSTRSSVS